VLAQNTAYDNGGWSILTYDINYVFKHLIRSTSTDPYIYTSTHQQLYPTLMVHQRNVYDSNDYFTYAHPRREIYMLFLCRGVYTNFFNFYGLYVRRDSSSPTSPRRLTVACYSWRGTLSIIAVCNVFIHKERVYSG